MKKKELNNLLIILNSNNFSKYPIGNTVLHQTVLQYEKIYKLIKYNETTKTWGKNK